MSPSLIFMAALSSSDMVTSDRYVLLQCVKQRSKLRVKMLSSAPYIKGYNCQFPRNVREEGMYYIVRTSSVTFRQSFYAVSKAASICLMTKSLDEVKQYVSILSETNGQILPRVIFGDDDQTECVICMSIEKDSVFNPCGHYVACGGCASRCKCCPMCRGTIFNILKRSDLAEDDGAE